MKLPSFLLFYNDKCGGKYVIGLKGDNNILRIKLDSKGNLDEDSSDLKESDLTSFSKELFKKLGKVKVEDFVKDLNGKGSYKMAMYLLNLFTMYYTPISSKQALFLGANINCAPHVLNSLYLRFDRAELK